MRTQVNVLIVDDSAFFRHRITEVLEQSPDIKIIATAVDGRDAVAKAKQFKPDIITMDVEMPVMDGITAVREIMAIQPTPILMFSNLTSEGAKVTLDALEAGAVDYLSKNFSPASTYDQAYVTLRDKVLNIALKTNRNSLHAPARQQSAVFRQSSPVGARSRAGHVDLVVIGASTGGPVALQTLLSGLPSTFPVPIAVMVHMPAAFTNAYAKRLNDVCALQVKEAQDHDVLQAGQVLLAPGGKQMLIDYKGGRGFVEIKESLPGQTYKPSVDVGFGSAARSYQNRVLAIVLTGMGADGKMGAQKLKQAGSLVWSQDQASCVVYGMPQAVEKAGLSDAVYAIDKMSDYLNKAV